MSNDAPIHDDIRRLVREGSALREERAQHAGDPTVQVRRLRELEGEIDQRWDLLRQRRALRAAGGDPEEAMVRPVTQVQAYRS